MAAVAYGHVLMMLVVEPAQIERRAIVPLDVARRMVMRCSMMMGCGLRRGLRVPVARHGLRSRLPRQPTRQEKQQDSQPPHDEETRWRG